MSFLINNAHHRGASLFYQFYNLIIILVLNFLYRNSFIFVPLFFLINHVQIEPILELFIGVINAKLFYRISLEILKPKNVQKINQSIWALWTVLRVTNAICYETMMKSLRERSVLLKWVYFRSIDKFVNLVHYVTKDVFV